LVGQLKLDFEDEVIAGACITRDGEIVHDGAKQAAAAAAKISSTGGSMDRLVIDIAVLVLAGFVGFAVISKVPNTLHTPLMSGTNAIHGIVVLGGLLLMAESSGFLEKLLLVIAVAFGTINVIGGFLVTDRMLGMFKQKEPPTQAETEAAMEENQ
jgi:NAD(P) transhydrogenase subunit alpha